MDHKILPNEFFIKESGIHLIKTRCPKELINDAMIHQRTIAANLDVGDVVRVQCFNHSYTTLLWYAEYLVYDRSSQIKRVEINDRDIRQVDDIHYSVMRITDWQSTPAAQKNVTEVREKLLESGEKTKPSMSWNPGVKKHQIKLGDEVLYEDADKTKAEEFLKGYKE